MKNTLLYFSLLMVLIVSCSKDDDNPDVMPTETFDRFVIVSNITTSATPTAYVGTFKDLSVENYTNDNAQQFTSYPFLSTFGDDVFVTQNRSGDMVVKYTRQTDGTLAETGRISLPSGSQPMHVLVENADRAYCTLYNTGMIHVFNPTTLDEIEQIDLTGFAKGDGSPDPGIMAFRDGKLYISASQTTDTYTSDKPAELLIVDTRNGNDATSITDDRATYLGNLDTPGSLFFDENGDLYVYCISSYGFAPGQKAGWLRIKNGENTFDPDYFFNTTDYTIDGIEGSAIDYLQHPRYYGDGIVYSSGNIPALASNPPDYINDRTFGAFKVDLLNQTITKLDIPNSNGYAATVLTLPDEGKVLFGMSATSSVGLFIHDHASNISETTPIITTQGDPSVIDEFE